MNKFYKNKFTSTIKTETEDQEVSVFGWEIYDEFEKLKEIEEKLREERESIVVNTLDKMKKMTKRKKISMSLSRTRKRKTTIFLA